MKTFFTFLLLCLNIILFGQAGTLDKTFGIKGKVISQNFGNCYAMAIQNDGKIVAGGVGYTTIDGFSIARYNTNGTLDSSFGKTGWFILNYKNYSNETIVSISILPDGKILLAGNLLLLCRLMPNGDLDSSFGNKGWSASNFGYTQQITKKMLVQADGKIILAGYVFKTDYKHRDILLARYHPNGKLDSTFGNSGKIIQDFGGDEAAYSAVLQRDGKIILGGANTGKTYLHKNNFGLIRYLPNGILDSTFGADGHVITRIEPFYSSVNDLQIQADNKIIAIGTASSYYPLANTSSNYMSVSRFNIDGSLDSSFGIAGKANTRLKFKNIFGTCVSIQEDGKILAGGFQYGSEQPDTNSNFILVRYNIDGSYDSLFGKRGIAITDFGKLDRSWAALQQSDGKIVMAGQSFDNYGYSFAISRYNGNVLKPFAKNTSSSNNSNEEFKLKSYPNPSHNGKFTIDLGEQRNNIRITVTDNNGRQVYTKQVNSAQTLSFGLNKPKGIYFLQVSFDGGKNNSQLVIE